jgi:hypothetical protein
VTCNAAALVGCSPAFEYQPPSGSVPVMRNGTPSELQAWLGHKNIQHTVRYTELAPDRFKKF